jgi:hypothetical protein
MTRIAAEVAELNLPVFTEAPREHRGNWSWEAVMRQTQPFRDYYIQHFDSPEKRLRDKNPEPFRLV